MDLFLALELGPIRVNMINAVVTTLAGTGALWLLSLAWKQAKARWLSRREDREADHVVITTGWSNRDVHGTSVGFLACVRAAPAKRLPAQVRLDVGRMVSLSRSAFGDCFSSSPEYCDPADEVRFRAQEPSSGGVEPYLRVSSDGLFEATVPIPHVVAESGELHLPIAEIGRVLLPAIDALQRGGYQSAFGSRAPIPLGLDWEIKVSRQMVNGSSTQWDALTFPGRAPEGRGTAHRPPWTGKGFGHDQLLSVPITRAPEDVLMLAFTDFLDKAGYYGTEGALDDLRAALRNPEHQLVVSDPASVAEGEMPPVATAE